MRVILSITKLCQSFGASKLFCIIKIRPSTTLISPSAIIRSRLAGKALLTRRKRRNAALLSQPVFTLHCLLMRTDDFDYFLPEAQIAHRPLAQRHAARLLLLNRASGEVADADFSQLPDLLHGDELLVFNNARVIPARLFGKRAGVHSQTPSRATAHEHLTGTVEVFLTRQLAPDLWQALVRPGRK